MAFLDADDDKHEYTHKPRKKHKDKTGHHLASRSLSKHSKKKISCEKSGDQEKSEDETTSTFVTEPGLEPNTWNLPETQFSTNLLNQLSTPNQEHS